MTKISARVAAANRARAVWIGRPLIPRVTRVLDEHAAFARIETCVAGGARRQYAVHHVDAEGDVVGDLLGLSYAHQVARTVPRQARCDFAGHLACQSMR